MQLCSYLVHFWYPFLSILVQEYLLNRLFAMAGYKVKEVSIPGWVFLSFSIQSKLEGNSCTIFDNDHYWASAALQCVSKIGTVFRVIKWLEKFVVRPQESWMRDRLPGLKCTLKETSSQLAKLKTLSSFSPSWADDWKVTLMNSVFWPSSAELRAGGASCQEFWAALPCWSAAEVNYKRVLSGLILHGSPWPQKHLANGVKMTKLSKWIITYFHTKLNSIEEHFGPYWAVFCPVWIILVHFSPFWSRSGGMIFSWSWSFIK